MSDPQQVPADQVWLVQQVAGQPLHTTEGPKVLLTIEARRNKSAEVSFTQYVLDQDMFVQTLAGLIGCGHAAFGREQVQAAMAKHLFGGQ